MRSSAAVRALERDLGELLERHEKGQDTADFRKYADDFVGFVEEVLGETLTDAQKDMAASVRDEQLTHVQAHHSGGKDHVAARLCLWWILAKGGLAIISGPTERQVKEILFASEIRTAWRKLRGKVRGELRTQRLDVPGAGRIVGFTATGLSQFTGWHHPLGVLVCLTEAQGLEPYVYKGAFACVAGEKDRLLCVGNPHNPEGPFWKASENEAWSRFTLSALDHPNVVQGREVIPGAVTQSFVDLIASQYGEDSPEDQSQVLGQFPRESEFGLLARVPVEAAIRLRRDTDPSPLAPLRAGLDIGRDKDPSMLSIVQGDHALPFIEFPPDGDLTVTLEKVEAVLYDHEFRPRAAGLDSNGQIVVDCSGLGAGVYDMMKARGWSVLAFLGGSTPWDSDRYDNTRAEAMFTVKIRTESVLRLVKEAADLKDAKGSRRDRLRARAPDPLALPDDPLLIEELLATRWYTTPQSCKRIEPKDNLRVRLGRSPDRLDALSMAVWQERGPRRATGAGQVVTL